MVATRFSNADLDASWFVYLALSVGVHLLVLSGIQLDATPQLMPAFTSMNIHLKARQAPAQTVNAPAMPDQVAAKPLQKKVVVEERAKQAIASQEQQLNQAQQAALATPAFIPSRRHTTLITENKSTDLATSALTLDQATEQVTPMPLMASEMAASTTAELGNMILEAKYRKQTAPIYPSRALELGYQGNVTLHAKIMPSGMPGELKVVKSSGYSLLDKAALAAVKKWEFEPTHINGNAIVSWVRVPVNFVIQ